MQGRQLLAVAGATAVLGLGVGAAGAQASPFEFSFGGAYTVSCDVSFTGTNGSPITLMPSFSTCNFMGLPATVTQSGLSQLTVVSPPSGGWYGSNYTIPSGTSMTITVPIAGCTISVPGAQTFANGTGGQVIRARNVTGGIEVGLYANSLIHSASTCPFSSGASGGMTTVTPAFVPGVTI